MSYKLQSFKDGQVLTAEHLNNMEQGIQDNSNAQDAIYATEIAAMREATQAANEAAEQVGQELQETRAEILQSATMSSPIVLGAEGEQAVVGGAEARNAVSLITGIDVFQAGSGDPAPDNIRPISGWNTLNVTRTGRNMLDTNALSQIQINTGETRYGMKFTKPGSYALCANVAGSDADYVYARVLGPDGNVVGDTMYQVTTSTVRSYVVNLEAGQSLIVWYVRDMNLETVEDCLIRTQVQVEMGVRTAYVPAQSTAITAALPETVYGGTLDWTTGVLTVTHKQLLLDETAVWNTFGSQGVAFFTPVTDIARETTYNTTDYSLICDRLVRGTHTFTMTGTIANACCISTDRNGIGVNIAGITTLDALKTWLSATPLNVVYELAAPYTIQLDPQTLSLLRGDNTIWCDAGETSIKYVVDTQHYVDNASVAYSDNAGFAESAAEAEEAVHASNADLVQGIDVITLLADRAPGIELHVSKDIISIPDAAARNALSVVSAITPAQAGSGDPTPDNVRLIAGWDALSLTRCGRNLLNPAWRSGNANVVGLTVTYLDDGRIVLDGTPDGIIEVADVHLCRDRVFAPGSYRISGSPAGGSTFGYRLFAWIKQVGGTSKYISDYGDGASFELVDGDTVTISIRIGNEIGTVSGLTFAPMLVVESTPCDYEPYQGQTLSADLSETVFGGSLDWTTGLLTVTHRHLALNGTEAWTASIQDTADPKAYYWTSIAPLDGNSACDSLCSHYAGATIYSGNTVQGCYVTSSVSIGATALLIRPDLSAHNTLDAWKTYLAEQAAAGTPVQIVYELATPYAIQIESQTLDMLKGYTNVWSSSGNTTITYVADTKLYIDNAIAAALVAQQA